MSDHDDIPALGALREQLREAAAREATPAATRRRRLRIGGFALVGVGLVTAAAAGAGALLSKGEPAGDLLERDVAGMLEPGAPLLIATDPGGGLPWGVSVHTNEDGLSCAVGGQVRGTEIGIVEDGSFRPFLPPAGTSCHDADDGIAVTHNVLHSEDGPERTLIFGRARDDVSRVTATVEGVEHSAVPRHGGAFLFLFEGDVAPADIAVAWTTRKD